MEYLHINCDLGEGGDNDRQLMPLVSACNIASGGHAGTVESMQETVRLAVENNVEIGAHPSYPDKDNFGRKSLHISQEDLKRTLVAQILALKQITEAEGGKLHHVKPHGALYNDAAKNEKTAEVVLSAIEEFEEDLMIYTPEKSALARLASGKKRVMHEAFADRNYEQNYRLISRQDPGALITKKEAVYRHLFSMFRDKKILCLNGEKIGCKAATFCLHSDTPSAVEILQFLHKKCKEENIKILNT